MYRQRIFLILSLLCICCACDDFATKHHKFGVADDEETPGGNNPVAGDDDADGLSNDVELTFDLETRKSDTDHDMVDDGLEFAVDTGDPLNASVTPDPLTRARVLRPEDVVRNDPDRDQDGLGDRFETSTSLDADVADTDGDGYDDGLELLANSDPFRDDIRPTRDAPPASDGVTRTGNAPEDSDNDGLANNLEQLNGTITTSKDSDGDGFSDGLEFLMGSDAVDELSVPNFSVPQPPDNAV